MIPLMSITRNFFMGREPAGARAPFGGFDVGKANTIARDEMRKIGIDVRDPSQAVGTLSGGERQCVAIARAVYFGARVLILDEPTSALGVKQASVVLRYVAQARARGLGRDLHHPQRPPRLPGRRQAFTDPQPRPHARHLRQGRDHARGAAQHDGGRQGARGAGAELEEFSRSDAGGSSKLDPAAAAERAIANPYIANPSRCTSTEGGSAPPERRRTRR